MLTTGGLLDYRGSPEYMGHGEEFGVPLSKCNLTLNALVEVVFDIGGAVAGMGCLSYPT